MELRWIICGRKVFTQYENFVTIKYLRNEFLLQVVCFFFLERILMCIKEYI